jgi:Na+-translocating ferredoxin:NAD+ oxidoreductase RnfE subunit
MPSLFQSMGLFSHTVTVNCIAIVKEHCNARVCYAYFFDAVQSVKTTAKTKFTSITLKQQC